MESSYGTVDRRRGTRTRRSRTWLLVAGVVAIVVGYVLTIADWGGSTGALGAFVLFAGLAAVTTFALMRIFEVSGGVDWSKLRGKRTDRGDGADEQRRASGADAPPQV